MRADGCRLVLFGGDYCAFDPVIGRGPPGYACVALAAVRLPDRAAWALARGREGEAEALEPRPCAVYPVCGVGLAEYYLGQSDRVARLV